MFKGPEGSFAVRRTVCHWADDPHMNQSEYRHVIGIIDSLIFRASSCVFSLDKVREDDLVYPLHTNFCTPGYMNTERMLQDNFSILGYINTENDIWLRSFLFNIKLPMVDSINERHTNLYCLMSYYCRVMLMNVYFF